MARFALLFSMLWAACVAPVFAQSLEPIAQSRFIYVQGTDFPGSDLGNLFDTDLQSCERACRTQAACAGFTYNTRSNACFPKSTLGDSVPYTGANSARKQKIDPGLRDRARTRLDTINGARPAIRSQDVERARTLAMTIPRNYPAGAQTAGELAASISEAFARRDFAFARAEAARLAGLTDAPAAWQAFAQASLRLPDQNDKRRRAALPAALNAVLRAAPGVQEAGTLETLADAMDAVGRGRDTIPVLRRAAEISGRADLQARLDKAIAQHGFRITGTQVDSDSASPRLCATFSEPLVTGQVDYDPYIRIPDFPVVSEASGDQLCIDGAAHGARYTVTFRAGLPAQSGEGLAKDVTLTLYVRDRAPSVRFPGRAYVLPRLEQAGLPVETVNVSTLDLTLRTVSDRNLLRAMAEDYFGRPLSHYQDQIFGSEIGAEVWTGTAQVAQDLNRDMTTRLPLDEMLKDRKQGIYALTARLPGADPYDDPGATQWFVVSDLGLSSFAGSDGLTVAVRGLTDAGPRGDVALTLISKANAVLAEIRTDPNGFARFPGGLTRGTGAHAPALLIAQTGDDVNFLRLEGPAFDLSDRGVEGRPAPGPIDAFLATDRGAYRPGEVIGVTALLRDAGMRGLDNLPLTAVLRRPDRAEYSRTLASGTAAGGHAFSLPLGHDIPRGTWRLDLMLGADGPPLVSRTVLVEDFLPERLDFDITLADGPLQLSDSVPVAIDARYLFGAVAADLPVDGTIRLRPTRTLADWPGYVFGPHDASTRPVGRTVNPARTNSQGAASLLVSFPEIAPPQTPLEAELTLRVAEGSGRPVERQTERAVTTGSGLIGLKPEFDDIVPEGTEAAFQIIALGPDGKPQTKAVRWVLNRIETRYQWYQLYGNWNWEPVTRRTRIAAGEMDLTTEPGRLALPTGWGEFELVATSEDGRVVTSERFYAGWYGTGDSSRTPDRLDVALDAANYSLGDTATVQIEAQNGGTALITVLSGDVILRRVATLEPGTARIPLTVTEDWGSGAYVTVSLLRPQSVDAPGPARAMGLAYAAVAPGSKALEVRIDAPDIVTGQSGDTEIAVTVAGQGNNPVWLTLSAVDLGILNLTGHDAPDPNAHYFGQRRLGVELRDIYGRLIDGQTGAMGQIRSGGDAGPQISRQAPPPTEAPMVFFSGLVQPGPDGVARIPVPRPDFNGTIRLDAIAWTAAAVGSASREMIARDPVVLTASLPRFMAPGDESRLLLELIATGQGTSGALPLQIAAPGLSLGTVPEAALINSGQKAVLDIPVRAETAGDFTIDIALALPDGRALRKSLSLGVRRNDPEIAQTRRFSLAPGETFTFDGEVMASLVPGQGYATVSAGPLARLDMPGLIAQLNRYPYGCTEQLTSAAMPLLYLSDLSPGVDTSARIEQAIRRILTRQSANGSFGLWRAGSGGGFWLDAYVTDFLTRARRSGHDVPDPVIATALDNLRNRVNYAADFDKGGEAIAYALLVLATEGAANMADLRYYADEKADAFATPLAQAQLGAALAAYGDSLRADAMFAKAQARLRAGRDQKARIWRADFGSVVSDSAAVARLASVAGSRAVDVPAALDLVTPSRLLSTQEAAQVLLAAHALRGGGEGGSLSVNGAPKAGPVIRRLENSGDGAVYRIANTGTRAEDITLTTLGVPKIAPDATGYGYALERAYFLPDGTPLTGPVTTGTQMVVVLTISPFEPTRARLMIEDPLPAGLEIDNPNLIRAGQIGGLDWLKPAQTENAEFLTDRFHAALTVSGTDPVRVAYKVRAVSPGAFHHPAASVHDMYRPDYRAVTQTGRWQVTR